jgi:hypothetical protein
MEKKKEEKKQTESEKLIGILKSLRQSFGQEIIVKLLVTERGVTLTNALTLKDYYSEPQDEEGADILLDFDEGINLPAAKVCNDLRYLG